MDPKIAKKTRDTLGKVITKPPLTEKLLGKPPFRFLHDITTSVIKTTGFMNGLFTDSEMNSENVKDKDSKIAFLQKAIDMVCLVTGKSLAVRPQKIVAGHEPEKTNEFLQVLAEAIKMKVDNDEYVKKLLNKGKGGEEKEPRSRSADKRKKEPEEKKDREKERSKDREKSRDRERDREKSKDRDKDGEKSRDREKGREKSRDRDREHRRKKHEEAGKENESPDRDKMVNGDESNKELHTRPQRPTSAKGSRRRRQGHSAADSDEEDEEFVQKQEPTLGEADLPPQVANARRMARPSSARPAPPRPKQDGIESEPAMRLGNGRPANVIVDNGQQSDDDDDNFIVEESAPPPPPEPDQMVIGKQEGEDDAEHGALVKKMLETKKEFEEGSQQQQQTGVPKKTEIERPVMSDAARRKQREVVQREIDKLRSSIQSLTRSANPLGKIMDYVQEDLDSMQKELEKWKAENKEHSLALRREKGITDRSVEPLKAQLSDLDQAIKDQLDLIAATKCNIIRNDQKIDKMLKSVAKS